MFTYHTDLAYPTLPRVRVVVEPLPATSITTADMHRLIAALEANHRLPQRRPFPEVMASVFPHSPAPTAPALSDWRARCVVYSTNQGNTWHVESPDRQHNLNGNHNRWQLGQFFYHNETQARKALSLAPIYPGATPCERSDESGASGVSSSGTTTRASTSDPATTPPRTSASDAGAMPSPVAVTNGPNPLTAAHVEKNAGEPCKHINTHRSPDGNERCDWCGCVIPSPLPNAEQGKGEPMLPACAHDKGIHFQSDPSGGSDSSYTCKACGKELTNRERQEADRRSLVAALGAGFSLTKPEPAPQVLTGDGVPIEVYDRVWFNDDLPGQKTPDWAEVLTVTKDEVRFRPLQRVRWLVPELCFSTRKAALASLPEPAPVGEGVNVDTPVGPIIVVGQASINNVVTMRDKLRDALAGEAVRREGDAVA